MSPPPPPLTAGPLSPLQPAAEESPQPPATSVWSTAPPSWPGDTAPAPPGSRRALEDNTRTRSAGEPGTGGGGCGSLRARAEHTQLRPMLLGRQRRDEVSSVVVHILALVNLLILC